MASTTQHPIVLATAGHVDHGKTALVRALTGHETDRLAEERRRGLTIEPGFAPLALPSSPPVSLVDVPGHERFIRQMVAGASGVHGFLLCVAADDGVMPQTEEHLLVLDMLGIRRGVVAVTKADLADPGVVMGRLRERLGEETEIAAVSAPAGRGLDDLRAALGRLASELARPAQDAPTRLFIDRAFSRPGAGTVVTGTLRGAPLRTGDRVRIEPGGARGRIRALEVHGEARERVGAGRVAVNISGVAVDEVPRGRCLVPDSDDLTAVRAIRADLSWHAAEPLRSRRRLQLLLGTAQIGARVRLARGAEIPSAGSGPGELALAEPVVGLHGDPFVLRDGGRIVGGGRIVSAGSRQHDARPVPVAPASAAHTERVAAALADAGLSGVGPERLAADLGLPRAAAMRALRALGAQRRAARVGDRFVDGETLAAAIGAARARLADGPLTLGQLGALWGLGRERALQLAEHMDAEGYSRRSGTARIGIAEVSRDT